MICAAALVSAAHAQGPAATQPLEPTGATLLAVTPAFRWTPADTAAAARPVAYRLRVARHPQLAAPLLDTVLHDVEWYDLTRPLKPGAPLYWRVDAVTAPGAASSTGTQGPHAVPPWATLTTLAGPGGLATDDPQPLFAWRSPGIATPPGPFQYELLVWRAASGIVVGRVLNIVDTSARAPAPLEPGVAHRWELVTHAGGDTSLAASTGTFIVLDSTVPPATVLYHNFPNPFPVPGEDRTCIWLDLAVGGSVELDILDLRGSTVRRLIPSVDFPTGLGAGRYGRGSAGGPACDPRFTWDGTTMRGDAAPAGVYLVRLRSPVGTTFRRIVFRGKGR